MINDVVDKHPKNKKASDFMSMFREARDFDPNRFEDYKELVAFYEGKQNELAFYQHEQPWVININAPYASDAIDIRVSSLKAKDYIGELYPLSPADVDKVTLLNDLTHVFWKEMQMDDKIDECIEKCSVEREAYIHITYDDDVFGGTNAVRKGKLKPNFIAPGAVCIDPAAENFKDADFIVITERVSKRYVKEKYKDKLAEGEINQVLSPNERGENYIDNQSSSEIERSLTKLTFYEKVDGEVWKTVLIENKIVEKPELFFINVYPITQLRWKKRFKSPYGLSLMDKLLPLQKSVNSIESATTNSALQFASPSFAVNRNSGINAEVLAQVIGAPGVVVSVNGNPSDVVKQLFTNTIDNTMISVKEQNEQKIYKLAGVTAEFLGNFGTAGNTAGGSGESSARAQIIENDFLSNLETFVQDNMEVIIAFLKSEVFAGEKVYTRSAKKTDGSFDFNEYQIPEVDSVDSLENIEVDYYVELDVKTPSSKEKTKMLLKELYQTERQYDSEIKVLTLLDVLENYDIPNKQEIRERYKNLVSKDNETKASAILQFTTVSEKYGIDANLISQGIVEFMEGKETPTVDAVLAQVEQIIAQQEQQQMMLEQQKLQETQALEQNMLQQQEVTGDEEFNALDLGDEEFNAI